MDKKVAISDKSKIAKDLASWDNIEKKLAARYGNDILNDRDLLKAKRDIYRHIQNKYKRKPLNNYERAEMKVLVGQQRRMLRQIYPNPLIRLIRNLSVFTGNLLLLIGKVGIAAIKKLSAANQQPGRIYSITQNEQSAAKENKSQEEKNTTQKNPAKTNSVKNKNASQTNSIVRKMPPKPRVQAPASQARGMRR